MFKVAANLLKGRTGRALIAIRDHPISASAMGIDTARYKTLAFGTSALFTGVAGAMSAIVIGYVSPEGFGPFLSISFLVGSAVGGIATIGGPILGGLFVQFIPNIANNISDAAPWAVYGVCMLVCMYVVPQGAIGFAAPRLGRLLRRIASSSSL
jgi:branched-chain amino acid transport system permease protein